MMPANQLKLSRRAGCREMLGRPVGLESEPGVGSRFWVVLSSDVLIAAITNLHLHLHRPEYAAR